MGCATGAGSEDYKGVNFPSEVGYVVDEWLVFLDFVLDCGV